ncbi:putative CCA tRNA nucleotidyltransferase 2 isoform X2 [Olea europaea var. sylvestris]|uniref:putative CCA tRNA nucleotidyltransferase 2 isoform X2 n=1 Tax=Olea europaea var. sylvestris TaxID=158386 RepID=UPI000C1D1C66|nr:putative CCA tRNA nucleotidyltransferase 2 isoform X2 [Olea europaea var. sylvestris]
MKLSIVTHRICPFPNPQSFFLKPSKFPFQTPKFPSSPPTINVHQISKRRLNFYYYYNCNYSFARSSSVTATMCTSPVCITVKDQIDLTAKEKQIFDRLLAVLRHFNLQTQLRVAGGWVRDKLLGRECYDIDIALDNMLGKEFCEKVNEYSLSAGEETHGIGVIQCNPDQSKHLETARMRLFDVWIDFVNLRSEDYSENSRIPTMKFGTAEEDAYRRDLTINSLFYNINTSSVEDFTGRGIMDLKSGKIVTPLPPKQTFLDDPLRVLRAIRFGARFGFMLDEELKIAAADDDVKAAIADKISRERIGHEIDLMISGNHPVKAMTYISDLQLFWAVFSLPSGPEPSTSEGCERLCVACMDSTSRLLQLIELSSLTDDHRRLCMYAALFLPFRKTIYRDNKGKKIPVVSYIFRNSLKLKASDAETVLSLHLAAEKFVSLIPLILSNEDIQILEVEWKREIIAVSVASKLRILAGLLLREIKEFWRAALVLSMLLRAAIIVCSTNSSNNEYELDKKVELFNRIEKAILELGLERVWEMKPLVNGKDIMNVLQIKSGGPVVKEWQKLLEWQLAHPSGSADECIDWMRQTHSKRARTE